MAEAFLKWAGGKRWFVQNESHRLPDKTEFNKYYEPFLGGGSVFFYIEPKIATLSDCNDELIKTFLAIRDDFEAVYQELCVHQDNDCKDYYYQVRSNIYADPVKAAARMIYMNNVCFNGIYRVNKDGLFNVPYGSGKKAKFNYEKLKESSEALRGKEIVVQDYLTSINQANDDDFVFCDPPYAVKTDDSFVGYNRKTFNWEDQEKLAEAVIRAAERGVKIMITNVAADEVVKLYDPNVFSLDYVDRKCRIAGGTAGRKIYKELIATANI